MTSAKRWVGVSVLLVAMSACSDALEAARLNAMSECTETVRTGGIEMPKLSASARAACMDRVRAMPRVGVNPCDELVRNEKGVWAYKLSAEDRKTCLASRK